MKHQEIRLHGQINPHIEYYVTIAALDAFRGTFYEYAGGGLRLFAPGNELILDAAKLTHRGNGGSFCEYMFGVEQPLADLVKSEVRNRLVMFGATSREDGSLRFADGTAGEESYERIFLEGNAVHNYFFFLFGSVTGPLRTQQAEILQLAGKELKRSPHVGDGDDARIIDELLPLLGHRTSLYLIKLIDRRHQQYRDAFRELYLAHRAIPDAEYAELVELAGALGLDAYQQERIRIDVMYKHPDNRRIVDEYKSILIDCKRRGRMDKGQHARLTRLKTLSVRSKIPSALFSAMDEVLKPDDLAGGAEPDSLAETRQILEGLFLHERQIDARVDGDDLIKLLHAKRRAAESRDYAFEQMLLETAKTCDEQARDGGDVFLVENFSWIITYFDRYDSCSEHISQLAFMDKVRFTEELVRSLLNNKKAFDLLGPKLFDELLFDRILQNRYLGQFGRQKLVCLRQGLTSIEQGRMTLQGLLQRLNDLSRLEQLYNRMLQLTKERVRHFYARYQTAVERDQLLREVARELGLSGEAERKSLEKLFRRVVQNLQMEEMYLHNLLPRIVAGRDMALREDFLSNSGLDRFYVEELEREYFEYNGLDLTQLSLLRQELAV